MNKLKYLLVFLLLNLLIFERVCAKEETISWRSLVQQIQAQIENGSLGKDFRFYFQNIPYRSYTEEELMVYVIKSDGKVFAQMGNQVRTTRISPNELIWLCKFLLEYGLAGLPENEPRAEGSAAYSIILRSNNAAKGIRLYNSRNDKNREIIRQYLFRFGQLLFEEVRFRDKTETLLPVCKGITKEEELDTDGDGVIDWLRLYIGFYNFKSADFVIDFLGNKQNIFLPPGNTDKEFLLNTYLLRRNRQDLKNFFKFKIDSKIGSSTGPYVMDIVIDSHKYKKSNFRISPDIVFKGAGKWRFKANLNQAVVLEIKKNRPQPYEDFLWFYITAISPQGVSLDGRFNLNLKLEAEATPLVFFGCMANFLRLNKIDNSSAIFEISWRVPDIDRLEQRIGQYKEMLQSGKFYDKEDKFRLSLEYDEQCKQDLATLDDLEIGVIYCAPPVGRI